MDLATIGVTVGAVAALAGVVQIVIMLWRDHKRPIPDIGNNMRAGIGPAALESPAKQTDLDFILCAKRIRVGCVRYPPFLDYRYVQNRLVVEGLYNTIAAQIAGQNELALEYVPLVWHEFEKALTQRKVDLILSVFDTELRRQFADPAAVMHRIQVGAVAQKTRNRHWTENDLKFSDVRIGVTEGEIGWEWVCEFVGIENNEHRIRILKNDEITNVMGLLVTGTVDIVLADALSCVKFIEQHGRRFFNPFQTKALDVCRNGILVRKGEHEFAEWITKEAKRVRKVEPVLSLERDIMRKYSDVITVVN